MLHPDERTIKAFAHVSQNVPAVGEWLELWFATEMDRLPSVADNVALAQGRCQVLKELTKFLRESPEIAAQPIKGSRD